MLITVSEGFEASSDENWLSGRYAPLLGDLHNSRVYPPVLEAKYAIGGSIGGSTASCAMLISWTRRTITSEMESLPIRQTDKNYWMFREFARPRQQPP